MDGTAKAVDAAETPAGRGVAALALATLLSSVGVSMANVALPTLAEDFAAPFSAVQWVVIAYLLASTTLIVGVGRLGDLVGQARMLRTGILLFTVATALCAAAPSLGVLVTVRALQGVGGAIMIATAMALVQATAARAQTGRVMGLLGTMSAIGTALGPSMGGLILALVGWRGLFLAVVPLGLVTFAIAVRTLPRGTEGKSAGGTGFDLIGFVLFGLALGALALAVTAGRAVTPAGGMALLGVFIIAGAGFVWHENRTGAPLIRLGALRDPLLGTRLMMNALISTVMMAMLIVGPFFLSRTLGLSAAGTGFVLATGPILSTFAGIPAGRAVDRFGVRTCVNGGLVAVALGAFALAVLPVYFGLVGYISAIVILTPGYQLFLAANNTAVLSDVSADQRGVTSGLLNLSRNLGLITGASLMGTLFALATGSGALSTASPTAIAGGQMITFGFAGGLAIVALVLSFTGDWLARTRGADRTAA